LDKDTNIPRDKHAWEENGGQKKGENTTQNEKHTYRGKPRKKYFSGEELALGQHNITGVQVGTPGGLFEKGGERKHPLHSRKIIMGTTRKQMGRKRSSTVWKKTLVLEKTTYHNEYPGHIIQGSGSGEQERLAHKKSRTTEEDNIEKQTAE